MTALRLALTALLMVCAPLSAKSQSFQGGIFVNTSGERIPLQWAYIGDEPGWNYPYIIYAVARSRPEGYWWFTFRNGCVGQNDYGTSYGFVHWADGRQTSERLFDQFEPNMEPMFTNGIQCVSTSGLTQPIEGHEAVLDALRYWQQHRD